MNYSHFELHFSRQRMNRYYYAAGSCRKKAIRQFRNRINHNEPICFVDNKFSFSEIEVIHNSIYELLNYIDKRIVDFVKTIDKTQETLNHLQ